jgi:hypothetical protein
MYTWCTCQDRPPPFEERPKNPGQTNSPMNVFYFHALKQRNTEHHDTIEQGHLERKWKGR